MNKFPLISYKLKSVSNSLQNLSMMHDIFCDLIDTDRITDWDISILEDRHKILYIMNNDIKIYLFADGIIIVFFSGDKQKTCRFSDIEYVFKSYEHLSPLLRKK